MTPEQIFALIVSLSGGPDPSAFAQLHAGGYDPAYPVTVTPCARPVAPDEIDGQTVICGTIAVPNDHRNPEAGTITIAFNLYKSHSLSPEPDPVVYLHGGPGGGTVSEVARTVSYFEHFRDTRDIIAFDERGVDSSAPEMDCYETLAADLGPAIDLLTGGNAPLVPEDFLTSCLAELDAKGIDYSTINTEQNAMDVPVVMSALGYDSYNIYGVSYGTKLSMEILRQNPPGLRAAIIDGNAPPWLPLYSLFWQSHSAPIQLSLAHCERDPACSAAYPDITARTFALIETLMAEPVTGPMGEIDGDVFFYLLDDRVSMSGAYSAITGYIPLMVKQLEEGDTTLIDQIRSGALPPAPVGSNAESARAAALAAGLDAVEMAQVEAMLDAAGHIGLAAETVRQLAEVLESELDSDGRGTDLADLFDQRLAAAIRDVDDYEARVAAGRDYLGLRFAEPSADLLVDLIDANFDEGTAASLAGLARQLDTEDVARVFDLVRIDNKGAIDAVEGNLQLFLYACQEDFSDGWNTAEKFAETMAADNSFGPAAQAELIEAYSIFFTNCPLFPKHPRENWTTVGTAQVPVLSMNGELDNQTAGIWGEVAVENYDDATMLLFPESGHGAIRYSQCARDITKSWLNDPEGELDTSCIADLVLPVMMPDGTMHPLAN